jgi:O-antigen/teichoic acid export membrane protein
MSIINIGREDVLWNYVATFLKIGMGIILLPFILRVFPQETVAIWTIFSTIVTLISVLDFGFNPSFARNVSYIISGVKDLKTTGYQIVEKDNGEIDYGLLKGLINAMQWFYARMALLVFLLLSTAGTYYIHIILRTYTGSHSEVYISWIILCAVNTYSFYTYYYDALMKGKGLIKRSMQIQIIANIVYLAVAVTLIMLRFDLIAIVSAQTLSIIIRRFLSYKAIYNHRFIQLLRNVTARAKEEYIKPILPNAIKLGASSLGGLLIRYSSIVIGSLYLSLDDIASYGITVQIIEIIVGISVVYLNTYQSKIAQLWVHHNNNAIKHLYLQGCFLLVTIFIVFGSALLLFGDWALNFVGSKTPLCSDSFIVLTLIIYFLQAHHSNAGDMLLMKNEVPFFKASLLSGCLTLILLFIFLELTELGIWGLILARGIADGCYQNWKWPYEICTQLNIIRINKKTNEQSKNI